jgi:hypothetical protein
MSANPAEYEDVAVCDDCSQPGQLVAARQVLRAADLENTESMLGQECRFHRAHVPPGWHVLGEEAPGEQ